MVPPGADHCWPAERSLPFVSQVAVRRFVIELVVHVIPLAATFADTEDFAAELALPMRVGREVAASAAVGRAAQRALIIRQCGNQLRLFQGNGVAIVAFLRAETVRVGGRSGTEEAVGQHR
jgi:hypothetical protein